MACAICLNYLLESVKLHDVHYFNSLSLLHGSLCTLKECEPTLSLLMKRWSRLSEPHINFLIRQLYSPSEAMSKVKGIENLEPLIHVVAITPFNSIPKLGGNARTWSCFTQDQNTNEHLHPLSLHFLKRWPFHEALAQKRPPKRIIDMAAVGPLARTVDLTRPRIANYINILNCAASRQQRLSLFKPSSHAVKILNWLKAGVYVKIYCWLLFKSYQTYLSTLSYQTDLSSYLSLIKPI